MPTALRQRPYRLFFYSADGDEPPPVHVERDEREAKFWLDPIRLRWSHGYPSTELNRIAKLVVANRRRLLRSRNEFFDR
jgi:hypothetical protein